jgi:putative acetyltransferase
VVERNGIVEGGGGVAPLAGGDAGTCELRKMYFLPSLRGHGVGSALMTRCLDAARDFGFERCYLETLTGMNAAMRLYERSGFRRIDTPMGATGHGGCNTFYLRELAQG